MSTQWTLSAGRTITTPNGSFYLTYGKDKYGNPHYRDFCELDRIAQQVAALPDLLAIFKRLVRLCPSKEGLGGHAPLSAFYQIAWEAKRVVDKAEGRG